MGAWAATLLRDGVMSRYPKAWAFFRSDASTRYWDPRVNTEVKSIPYNLFVIKTNKKLNWFLYTNIK